MADDNTPKNLWEADSTHPEIAAELREHLREINDPELGLNIIQLGLVRDVSIKEDSVLVKMILTTPYCPYGPALLEMSRKKVEEITGKPTTIEYTMEAWDFSMMEDGAAEEWGFF
ncbi:MAG: metal-sulfur cluster assembly factor [Anaerolineales bacterium]